MNHYLFVVTGNPKGPELPPREALAFLYFCSLSDKEAHHGKHLIDPYQGPYCKKTRHAPFAARNTLKSGHGGDL